MFVLEIRDSRCRSAGAISGILGHVLCLFMVEFSFLRLFAHAPHLPKMIFNDLSRLRELQLLIKHARLYFT